MSVRSVMIVAGGTATLTNVALYSNGAHSVWNRASLLLQNVTFVSIGRTTFATRRPIGNIFSIYQDSTSGRLSSLSVSAVGAQSTTIKS